MRTTKTAAKHPAISAQLEWRACQLKAGWLLLVAMILFVPSGAYAGVSVTISPSSVNLAPNISQQFTASVTGASDTSVTWSIQEGPSGGTVTNSGLYTAPGGIGTYHVIATSNADNTQSATATVGIPGILSSDLIPADTCTATLLPNGTVLFAGGEMSGEVTPGASAEIYNPTTLTITATGNLVVPRCGQTATLLPNGKVLLAGGQATTGVTATAEVYDPISGTFTATGSMSAPRSGHTATLLSNGKVLVVGGGNCISGCVYYSTAELYDPGSGTFSPAGSMSAPHVGHTATLLNSGKVLIAGGYTNGGAATSDAELYDPATGLFIETGAMVFPRESFTATLLSSGKVLIAGGDVSGAVSSTAELYDPSAGTFSQTGSLNIARALHNAASLPDGEVLIAAGVSTLTDPATAELYDPNVGSFSLTGSLEEPRYSPVATSLPNGSVLIAGGGSGQSLGSLETYNPASGNFTSQSVFMNVTRTGHTSTTLADGRLLLIGGQDVNGNAISSAEIYDPATRKFTFSGSLIQGRYAHTATLLSNGDVLVVGGFSDSQSSVLVSTAELYDPTSGTFSQTSNPNIPRAFHTSTLLPNGEVLIAGGIISTPPSGFTASRTVELYDPNAGTFALAGNMSAPRYRHTATKLNDGRVFIAGGVIAPVDDTPPVTIPPDDLYDPSTGMFTPLGTPVPGTSPNLVPFNFPFSSTLLASGQVLVDAGTLFDPASNSFSVVNANGLQNKPVGYIFTLLANDAVFMAGLADQEITTTYLFEPALSSYVVAGNLEYYRSSPTDALLPDGEVLVTGGAGVREVEFYVPAVTAAGPSIASLSPSSATAGSGEFLLQVTGANFSSGSIVYFDGQPRTTTFVSTTQLTANILGGDIANGGTAVVDVYNPPPEGGTSTSVEFAVINPLPAISSLDPNSVVAGDVGFALAINGSGFVPSSTVTFDGSGLSATFVDPTQLLVQVSSSYIASQGSASVTVTNPSNGGVGGGTSPPATLTILPANVQPVIGALSPPSTTAGGPAFTLSVTGNAFTASSVISFNSNVESTVFINSTELQATIPAAAITVAGEALVLVTNPGGGISVASTFTVNNPPPGGGGVNPPSLPAGSAALTLNVTGTNFTASSTVLVNGSSRVTAYVSPTLLQATLLPSDLSHGGTLSITVSNPPPGGGTTLAMTLSVADYTVTGPTTPASVEAGMPATFILSVAPSNGTFSDPVTFTASGLPAGATGSFTPSATVTPGSTATNVTLSISTTSHTQASLPNGPVGPGRGWPLLYMVVAVLGVIAIGSRTVTGRSWRAAPEYLLILLILLAAAGMAACGAMGNSSSQQVNTASGTPAGTYSIVITATSGGVAHTSTVTLTVM